jgi:hypothetical protein
MEGSESQQAVVGRGPGAERYHVNARIWEVRAAGDSGAVRVEVTLTIGEGVGLHTLVNLRSGQTAVLGNVQPDPGGGTIILTVRPELVSG